MVNKNIILNYYKDVLNKKHFNMLKCILDIWNWNVKKTEFKMIFDINTNILSVSNFFNDLQIYNKYLKIESKHFKYIRIECFNTNRIHPNKKFYFDIRLVKITIKDPFIQTKLINK